MSGRRPQRFRSAEECVEAVLGKVGERIVLGLPLGLGKPNPVVNALYRRAKKSRALRLRILTALSLERPRWKGELERRLVEPLVERIFGDYPDLEYAGDLRSGRLPPNVEVSEFYFAPGRFLGSPTAQQSYMSSNYTHVVRDALDAGVNVVAQLVAREEVDGRELYSLSSNPDVSLDLVPRLRDRERRGERIAVVGEVHPDLPFFYGDAAVEPEAFDFVLDDPAYRFRLFGPPNPPVGTADYLIALHASALVRDGGTIQLGIGSMGDAVTYLLELRHRDNPVYRSVLSGSGAEERFGGLVEQLGGAGPFERGLYASSEMLVGGFLELYRTGILKRRVYDDPRVQRVVDEGGPGPSGGAVAHASFFLGPQTFYDGLRRLSREQREEIRMTRISYVNELYGEEERKRFQRRQARFLNSGMIATLLGAVASDALEDGRVVSGVGGQYNFVAMAHALEDGRSILMIRSTREQGGKKRSNLVWRYGHTTIPRHLRDLVVTEYGIADLRGKTDRECVEAMLAVADSRFQDGLLREAKRAGKIPRGYRIPERFRDNHPGRLERLLASHRREGLFPLFPFGTDLTEEEIVLSRALRSLRSSLGAWRPALPSREGLRKIVSPPPEARRHLERMKLDAPRGWKERLLQKAVLYALVSSGALGREAPVNGR